MKIKNKYPQILLKFVVTGTKHVEIVVLVRIINHSSLNET